MLGPSKARRTSKQEDGAANLRNRGLALRAGRPPYGCTPAASPWSTLEHAGHALSRYDVERAAGTDRPASVARPRLFRTPYAAAQPGLFGFEALRLREYAARLQIFGHHRVPPGQQSGHPGGAGAGAVGHRSV